MAGVTSGAAFLAEDRIVAIALGDIGADPGVVADSAAASAVADHRGRRGPWVPALAAIEDELCDHDYHLTRGST